jgi:predicted nuclease of predicted toxin-antitoxin system
MPIALYMDHHVSRAITLGLRMRGVDVLTALEDGASELSDPDLLDRAGTLGRVLFSQDRDLPAEAARRQREGIAFQGLLYVHPLRLSIGACVRELELIAKAAEPEDLMNRVSVLPL